MTQLHRCVCPHDCPDACGLLVGEENGKIVSFKGDPGHPFTQGFICTKAAAYPKRVHSPKRVSSPLLRTGPKGSGSFKEIPWPDALDLITARMQGALERNGAQSILPYSYAGTMGLIARNAGHAFFHKLGASRLLPTICGATGSAGFQASLGSGPCTDLEQTGQADLIIIWGSNTLTTNLHAWPFFSQARKNGARIIMVDPYRNRTAKRADLHLMIKPGADAALAMAMMKIIWEQGLADQGFLSEHALGFDRFLPRLEAYPLGRAESDTGIPLGLIQEAALAYGRAGRPFIRLGYGPGRQLKGAMAMRTVALLPALVGAFGHRASGVTHSTSGAKPLNMNYIQRPDLAPRDVRAVNMVQLGSALNDLDSPPVDFLYVYLSNPAAVAPDSGKVMAGLARDGLFTVVHEQFLTDTARYADLVLPGVTFLEEDDLYSSYGHYYLQFSPQVIPPQGQARPTLEVFQELAHKMGFGESIFSQTRGQIMQGLLQTDSPFLDGVTPERLKQGGPVRVNLPANPWDLGFQTPSGKVEFYSRAMEQAGLDPLPNPEPSHDPQGRESYPLQLITPPHHFLLNSTFNDVEELRQKNGPPCAMIHPSDAGPRGIKHGDLVRVHNSRGSVEIQARITDDAPPGLVIMEGIHWPSLMPGGKGANQLTSQTIADLGGSNAFHCNLVDVAPLKNG